ncbi:MAG: TonB-dependent receptor [Myxococcota bacterium]
MPVRVRTAGWGRRGAGRFAFTLAGALCAVAGVRAEAPAPPTDELERMSLEELMALPVAVATPARPVPPRRAPGLVTVITRREILESGARDLVDVLMLVPGFHFGTDVQGSVGVGFRGLWGEEGKILLLVDGQELNELDYGTTQWGDHFPVDQIERIEIIRGPGSVLYGGFAELAVVDVITRSADELDGFSATATYGQMQRTFARRTLSLQAATPVRGVEGLDLNVGAYFGEGHRSDRTYRDLDGNSFPMAGNARTDPRYLNAALRYRDLQVRFIFDGFRVTTRDGFGPVLPRRLEQDFPASFLEARYTLKPNAHLTLTPRVNFKHQVPWRITDKDSALFSNRFNQRLGASFVAAWNPHQRLSLLAGLDGYLENHALLDRELVGLHRLYSNGRTNVQYANLAVLAQASGDILLADATLGVRYEHHSHFGGSFVPRLALTRTVDPFHVKVLFARAFRSPSVQNLAINPRIRPERTSVVEVETGARVGRHVALMLSGFQVLVEDPIIYQSFVVGTEFVETYRNLRRTGARGVEAELRLQHPRGRLNLGYSFYSAVGLNAVEVYAVPGRPDVLLGFPAHKLTVHGALSLTRKLTVAPSAVVVSERFSRGGVDGAGNPRVVRHDPALLLNLYFGYRDLGIRGLEAGFGVFNILDVDAPFIQPFDGGHAPLPGPSRELMGRVSYAAE